MWTPQRRDALALRADVRVLEDGTWAIGDSRGEVVYPSDTVPRIWGQLAHAVAIDQPSLLPGHLFGTAIPPMQVEPSRPVGPPPGVSPADQEQLTRVVAVGAAAAPAIQAAIESAAAAVTPRIRTRATHHAVEDRASRQGTRLGFDVGALGTDPTGHGGHPSLPAGAEIPGSDFVSN